MKILGRGDGSKGATAVHFFLELQGLEGEAL